MKAQVLFGVNDIKYKEKPIPEPQKGEVLVRVHAVGICGSDIPRIYQTGAHQHPIVPGHEFSGEVIALGEEVEKKWKGKRVGIFPLIPCKKCELCQKKLFEMCRNYSYLGSRCDGGFAEYVVVPEWNLLELPDGVSYEVGAMLEPMAVATHAMRSILGDVQELGEQIVVLGLGTIGLLLAMILKEAGYRNLFLVGNKDYQKNCLKKIGIGEEFYCDGKTQNVKDWILRHTDGEGAKIIFECVGKKDTISQAIDLCAPVGQVILVGNPYSDIVLDKQIYWKILRNQLLVRGTWNSSFTNSLDDDWHYVLDLLEQGCIHPDKLITHHFPLEKLQHGMQIMRDKSEDYVKIMCVMD